MADTTTKLVALSQDAESIEAIAVRMGLDYDQFQLLCQVFDDPSRNLPLVVAALNEINAGEDLDWAMISAQLRTAQAVIF